MRIIIIIFLSLCMGHAKAQIVPLFKGLVKTTQDTTIELHYFKNADSILVSKIDSFDLFLKQKEYKLDSNYFYRISFLIYEGKSEITIAYQSQYNDYLMLTKPAHFGKRKNELRSFSFFFYKNRLMLCAMYSKNILWSNGAKHLLKNLIYENVNELERKLICHPPADVIVRSKPAKGYSID